MTVDAKLVLQTAHLHPARDNRRRADMRSLAAEWAAMGPDEKARFDEESHAAQSKRTWAPPAMADEDTPFGIGTASLPVGIQFAEQVATTVTPLADEWKANFDSITEGEDVPLKSNVDAKSCSRIYGVGKCKSRLTAVLSKRRDTHQFFLNKLVYYEPSETLPSTRITLPLICFNPLEVPHDPNQQILAIRCARLKNPVLGIYLKCKVGGNGILGPGAIVLPCLIEGRSGFWAPGELLWSMTHTAPKYDIIHVTYRFRSLFELEVITLRNITEDLKRIQGRSQVSKDAQDVSKVVKGMFAPVDDAGKPKKPRGPRGPRKPREPAEEHSDVEEGPEGHESPADDVDEGAALFLSDAHKDHQRGTQQRGT